MNFDWTKFGKVLRQSANDAHGGPDQAPDVNFAYQFLLDNPECFGEEEWPTDMPQEPNIELIAAYYDREECEHASRPTPFDVPVVFGAPIYCVHCDRQIQWFDGQWRLAK